MVRSAKIFAWHHWCGLIAGLFLLIMSISGAILVFSPEIDAAFQQPWLKLDNPAGSFSYDTSLARVRHDYPGWEIRLADPPGANEAIVYDIRKGAEMKKVFAHPVSGSILHVSGGAERRWHRQLLTLHYTLFAGRPGKILVFAMGLVFLLSLFTGIFIYRRAVGKVLLFKFALRGKTGRAFYSSLHRITGVWSLFFNLMMVSTGLFISGGIILGDSLKKSPETEKQGKGIFSMDKIRSSLSRQYPGFAIHFIRVAGNARFIEFAGRLEEDPPYYGKYNSRFIFDAASGDLLQKRLLKEQDLAGRLKAFSQPLHFGNYGGLFLKCMYSLFGLMPGLLSISGFLIWKKKTKQAQRRINPAPVQGAT